MSQHDRELLNIASQPDPEDSFGRDASGKILGFTTWQSCHPQRDSKVNIITVDTQHDYMQDNDRLIIWSWNILSNTWFKTSPRYESWEIRMPRIAEWIRRGSPDIVCLQEIDIKMCVSTLLEKLQLYSCIYQLPKKQSSSQPCWCAIIWNDQKLKHIGPDGHFSRAMAVNFELIGSPHNTVTIINAHLQASAGNEAIRARQLNSALKFSHETFPQSPIIIGGDFNSVSSSFLHFVLRTHTWHGQQFASVYEHLTGNHTMPVNGATFLANSRRYIIDHLLYNPHGFILRSILDPLNDKQREHALKDDLPNEDIPSDHIPIGAILEWKDGFTIQSEASKESSPVLTQEQMVCISKKWECICENAPDKQNGKPTPAALVLLRKYAVKTKVFKNNLTGLERAYWKTIRYKEK